MLGKSVETSTIGFAVIDEAGIIIESNQAFCDMLQLSETTVAGYSLVEHISTQFYSAPSDLIQALKQPDAAIFELHRKRDAAPITVQLAKGGQGLRLLITNILPKFLFNTGLMAPLVHRDPLTGLGNRELLNDIVESWQPRGEEAKSVAVILLDLDRFKPVNETLGHGAGDTLLKLVAKRIVSTARHDDVVIRMGGDEFLVLQTTGKQPDGAQSVAKRILELISRPFLVDGQQVNIGASIGIAALNHGTNQKTDLLKHADLALNEAKAAGRSNIKFFEPELAHKALERRQFQIDLQRALGLREFSLVFQPQVQLPNGKLIGFEALIRWHHPVRGLISPAEFIPLAEETGEIHAIGEWVLQTACKTAAAWDGDFLVAVNVSPIQFENDRIVKIVSNALAVAGLPPERLELEITEGVLIKEPELVLQRLWEIKTLGVAIAMDDFGTGYSSLSYLNSFPFSKIKIDQEFVRGEKSAKSRALVKAIISLGESLNMTTLAEGVETKEQYIELVEGGCTEAQGYLISRPIPPQAIAEFIANMANIYQNIYG